MSSQAFLAPLREDLEFPLALGHLGVDAFEVDAGVEADVDVLLDDLAGDVADVLVADAGVVRTLRTGIAVLREAQRPAVLVQEVLLLEADPQAFVVVRDGGAEVRRVRALVLGRGALRTSPGTRSGGCCPGTGATGFSMQSESCPSACCVELPSKPQIGQSLADFGSEFDDLRLAAEVRFRQVAVQPDVLQLVTITGSHQSILQTKPCGRGPACSQGDGMWENPVRCRSGATPPTNRIFVMTPLAVRQLMLPQNSTTSRARCSTLQQGCPGNARPCAGGHRNLQYIP